MNDLDDLRIEHATKSITTGQAALRSDPTGSYYKIWSGRMILIATKLKCSGDVPFDDVLMLAREAVDVARNHGVPLAIEKQNEILILSLAANDIDGARQVAQIDCAPDHSHAFDIALNRRLRGFFCGHHADKAYTPTVTEQGFFDDLEAIANKRDTDLSGTDRYWSATKSTRYSNTAFGFNNLFRLAFANLQGM